MRSWPPACWSCSPQPSRSSASTPEPPASTRCLTDSFAKSGALALERSFPGASTTDPAQVVVSGDIGSTDVTAAIERFEASIADDPDFGPSQHQIAENGQVAVISIPLVGDPDHSQARRGLERLRTDLIPAAFDGTETSVLVGGTTAENVDYSDLINKWLPIVLAFVLGLSFILLTLVFRSVVVSATAVVLNLLSVGAAYGLLVLVFQHGVGADLLGLQQVERVEAWVPVFLFSVLFALSMDYHVFLLSRIRERYAQTGDTNQAVVHGIAATGRIITGAALIIVVVFAGFAAGQLVMFQQMGFGVAVALLVDATLIRMIVVPAAMTLLGDWNWYLPNWLELAARAPRRRRPGSRRAAGRSTPVRSTAVRSTAADSGPGLAPSRPIRSDRSRPTGPTRTTPKPKGLGRAVEGPGDRHREVHPARVEVASNRPESAGACWSRWGTRVSVIPVGLGHRL